MLFRTPILRSAALPLTCSLAVAQPPSVDGCVGLAGTALGFAGEVKVSGTTACVLNGALGIDLADYTDPLSPVHLSTVQTPYSRFSLDVEGHLLVHCGAGPQIGVVDIRDPAAPQQIADFDLAGGLNCRDIVLRDGIASAVTPAWPRSVPSSGVSTLYFQRSCRSSGRARRRGRSRWRTPPGRRRSPALRALDLGQVVPQLVAGEGVEAVDEAASVPTYRRRGGRSAWS